MIFYTVDQQESSYLGPRSYTVTDQTRPLSITSARLRNLTHSTLVSDSKILHVNKLLIYSDGLKFSDAMREVCAVL